MLASIMRPPTIDRVSAQRSQVRWEARTHKEESLGVQRTEEVVAEEVMLRMSSGHSPKAVDEEVDEGEHSNEGKCGHFGSEADSDHGAGDEADERDHDVKEGEAALHGESFVSNASF